MKPDPYMGLRLACVIFASTVCTTHAAVVQAYVPSDQAEANSDYVRVPGIAIFGVIAFPLVLCCCCLCCCLHGCFKGHYAGLDEYDGPGPGTDDDGLIDVEFKEHNLGLVMKEGLVTEVDPATAAKYDVEVKDRVWCIGGEKVTGMDGKQMIKLLVAHHKRPIKIQFLRPSQTNIKIRTGIMKHETKNHAMLTSGALKGIECHNSMPYKSSGGKVEAKVTEDERSNPIHEAGGIHPMQISGPPPLPHPTSQSIP